MPWPARWLQPRQQKGHFHRSDAMVPAPCLRDRCTEQSELAKEYALLRQTEAQYSDLTRELVRFIDLKQFEQTTGWSLTIVAFPGT
jgi:hypothetical protein